MGAEIAVCKRTEEALGESEDKFRVLAETSTAAIFIYQGDRAVSVNKAAETITGYSKDELLKMKYWEIVHPDFREEVMGRSLARQHGEPVPSRYEVKLLTKSGEIRWAELTAGRIMYMGMPAGVATLFDITERKQAEEKARLTQFAVDHFTDSSIWLNEKGEIVYVNIATAKALGYSFDELLSMKIWDIDPDYPYEKYIESWNETKRLGARKIESIHMRKDGSIYSVEISINYLKFEDREYLVPSTVT